MERSKLQRMSILFEKMVSECASKSECGELKSLYQEYIDDGRDKFNGGSQQRSHMEQKRAY